ncbi:hypothetical protein HWB99_gp086 [Mycobacterium phage DrLupo]|uniref:Uncharacterized protein n=1 Tax=Mycobacterium phage DrLupo TaxID=2499037 RepID=A0A3S9UQQ8_9CAUD|nr:hypothetical protein HWB99_gp086 [Mycobacterium phage DrLupo]AZS12622.1 hypothetical protein SEA_DRLUPO_86 [Mycobacterium phage DrLupo]
MGKKKKAKKKPQPSLGGGVLNAAFAQLRERMADPEVQARMAASFSKLRPQVEAIKEEMGKNPKRTRSENEDGGPDIPVLEGTLLRPMHEVTRARVINWYWTTEDYAVVATFALADSERTTDVLKGIPGARKGDYAVSVFGRNGGSITNLTPTVAKSLGEALLSAHGWEHVWPKHYQEPDFTTEGGEMAYIPHDDPGPTIPASHLPPMATGVDYVSMQRQHETTRDEGPAIVPLAEQMQPDIPTGESGQPDCLRFPGGGQTEAEFLGNTGGFGDSEAPPAAPDDDEWDLRNRNGG